MTNELTSLKLKLPELISEIAFTFYGLGNLKSLRTAPKVDQFSSQWVVHFNGDYRGFLLVSFPESQQASDPELCNVLAARVSHCIQKCIENSVGFSGAQDLPLVEISVPELIASISPVKESFGLAQAVGIEDQSQELWVDKWFKLSGAKPASKAVIHTLVCLIPSKEVGHA